MSTVFYRKWRPTRFSDVVGQEHITDTLRRAVLSDRVAHAYLFTGPRGVGKTSTARILAKALNAELDEHGDPIPDTENAIAIDEGRFMDLIEIDAASNRGVGDIRDLRERVLLRPTVGQFKVYIIDEVHMLTTEAFNALLKTLEEPPPQVVMILATTDIHRVPATIISRCQRFDFRRLTTDDVIGRLILICDEEEIECEPAVLELVARSAWGSLRDAENLLEQLAVSYGTGEITEAQARELLGIGDTSSARNLASAILRKDAKRALEIIEEEASRGAELKGLRDSTISALRGALLAKHGIASIYGELGDAPDLEPEAMNASTDQMLHAITIFGRNERFGEASSPLALEIAALQAVAEPPKPEAPPAPATQSARQPTRRSAPAAQRAPQAEPAPSQPAPADTSGTSRILEEIGKVCWNTSSHYLRDCELHRPQQRRLNPPTQILQRRKTRPRRLDERRDPHQTPTSFPICIRKRHPRSTSASPIARCLRSNQQLLFASHCNYAHYRSRRNATSTRADAILHTAFQPAIRSISTLRCRRCDHRSSRGPKPSQSWWASSGDRRRLTVTW